MSPSGGGAIVDEVHDRPQPSYPTGSGVSLSKQQDIFR
jgi:hypothetical protein